MVKHLSIPKSPSSIPGHARVMDYGETCFMHFTHGVVHRDLVSMMAKGCIVARGLRLMCFLFLLPNCNYILFLISCNYNAIDFIS